AVSRGTILPVPSRVPELLGITGVRGTVVPVFSLAALLGFSSNATEPRWLMFCGAKQAPVAFAFDELEGHFEVPGTDVYVREAERGYVNETARDGSRLRAVIGIARLVHQVTQRKQPGS
ncbi:MAG: chemotaxis protein CheW, partial [Candidatus Korobacteraceae bacterium]